MRTLWSDIIYGLRMLAKNPGFTAVAILSLAIGIGANTATFSLADAILLRPLPVDRPSEIVRIDSTTSTVPSANIVYRDFVDFRAQSQTLAGLVAYRQLIVGFHPNPETPSQFKLGLAVSPDYFDVLGVKPALGRSFRGDEERQDVVMLSDSTWESQFNRDPSVIGRHIELSKIDFTIIGVVPKSFPSLDRFVHESLYVPIGVNRQLTADNKDPLEKRDTPNVVVYGRLRAGRSEADAQAELKTIAANLERAYPDTNRGRSVLVRSELEERVKTDPENTAQTAILLVIAGLVLMIACANVANLLLSRARARSREIAIRLAIGAGRARLFRQLLTESLVLAVLGGAAGLLVTRLCIRYFDTIQFPTSLPLGLAAYLDQRVLLFCAAASVVCGVIFGVAPALHTLRTDLATTLKSGDAAPSKRTRLLTMRSLLVVSQVAVSMMLLVVSGLLVKDFANLAQAKPGFRTDHLLLASIDPELARYTEPQGRAFYHQLLDRVRSLPGVKSVALGAHVPLGVSSSNSTIGVEGYQLAKDQKNLSVLSNTVDDRYFDLMQIPLVSGRSFDRHDVQGAPLVAIVNETMAKTYWPKRSAIGGRIHKGDQTIEVVGIAKDLKYRELSELPTPFLYLPFEQQYSAFMTMHVESAGDPASLAGAVTGEIRRLDPGMTLTDVQTMQHFFSEGALLGNRLIMNVVTAIGIFGLILAIGGMYGVIAYSVSRRTREIGIRMAIGADPRSVAILVMRQGFILTASGIVIGLALALGVSELLKSLLVGVSVRDPWVYALVPALLSAISLLACYVPARRAAQVDPLVALRQD
jgi:predicted permease